jgi:hypothetical protein
MIEKVLLVFLAILFGVGVSNLSGDDPNTCMDKKSGVKKNE